MKVKVLSLILITTIGIAILDHFNLLGKPKTIQVQAHFMQYTCGKNNIDMRVVAADGEQRLIGKLIAPELKGIDQNTLTTFVLNKTQNFAAGLDSTLQPFTLIGYFRESKQPHCSGAICFKVVKIKYAGDSTFVEF